jgi:mRNA interferase MazF
MVMRRGQIWWAELPVPTASEPGYRRPLLIIQADSFNRSRINTVIALVLTSNLRLADAPGNVFLPKEISGLPKDSAANVSQIITLDRSFLVKKAGKLSPQLLSEIEEGVRLVLGF